MSSDAIRRRVLVSGRVQGVFFRDSVRRAASEADVAGRAVNLDDGRVEVVLEGQPEAVQRVIEFCRQGPGRAEVRDVQVSEEEPEGLSAFETA
jgi:acylphosphatase